MNYIARSFTMVLVFGALTTAVLAQERDESRPRPPQNQQIADGQRQCPSPCPVRPFWRCILFYLAIIHLLLAYWVFSDLRKRGEGHGIFVVLVLLGGLPAAVVYALVRIGDIKRAS
jgi:hypothetical protein